MSKIDINKIKGHFPLTVQNARTIADTIKQTQKRNAITASNYQSDNVNAQQFYKPISKILSF